jgi:N-carbamoylputrescine amidase
MRRFELTSNTIHFALEAAQMPRIVRCSIIQASNAVPATEPLAVQKQAMVEKHLGLIRKAAGEGAQIVCLQEIFNGPYFCAEQSVKWYENTEAVPSGPTVTLMQALAKELRIAMVVPVYEVEQEGIFYNTAAVIQNDGTYLGKYRKTHIPHVAPGFWEKFYFRPGNLGYPVFDLGFAKIGVYICYDRHFPEGARCLGLNGAEIVFNPSATVAGLSEYLWKLEQPAHAAANGYFIAAINRVGTEPPWNIGEFYGSSYFADPRGQIIAQASRDKDEVLTVDLNLDEIAEVRRTWQFYRDRRPDLYGPLVAS